MSIGSHVRIDPFCVVTAGGPVEIGSHVHIAAHCLLSGGAGIRIGDFCGVSHGSRLLSMSDDFRGAALTNPTVPDEFRKIEAAPVVLGAHALVGANCVALPGAVLEEGAAVGALSLISGALAGWMLHAGVPARPIGARDRNGILQKERDFLKGMRPG